jgi:thioredoxin 1
VDQVLNLHRAWRRTQALTLLAVVEVLSMSVKRIAMIIVVILPLIFLGVAISLPFAAEYKNVPVKGMVTMVDLGAGKCIPCKMMAPILERLQKQYAGRAAIIFLDVWEDREPAHHFGIRGIPTQIFFDKAGKEVYRHGGFMSEEAIVAQLKSMGVQ